MVEREFPVEPVISTLEDLLYYARAEVDDDTAHRTKLGTVWYDEQRIGRLLARGPALARGILLLLGNAPDSQVKR